MRYYVEGVAKDYIPISHYRGEKIFIQDSKILVTQGIDKNSVWLDITRLETGDEVYSNVTKELYQII